MPGRQWYLIALVVALAGFACAGLFFWLRFDSMSEGLIRMVAPGETVMALRPGAYTVFHEYSAVLDGRYYEARDILGMHVVVASEAGEQIALRGALATRYELTGHKGVSVLAFDIDAPGNYRLKAAYEVGNGPETVLAVGQGFIGRLFTLILGTIGIAFVTAGGGVAIASVTYVKRRRARETRS
jgi:hypothetical protein